MQKIIYCKILYIDNIEMVELRTFLVKNGYIGNIVKKKQLEMFGLKQITNVFLITSKKNNTIEEFKNFIVRLNAFDCLQVLGLIENKLLVVNSVTINLEKNLNFRPYIFTSLIIKNYIQILIKKFLVSNLKK